MAEIMVARGELSGISAGYHVDKWAAHDENGNELDVDRIGWSDDGLTFTAKRWQLYEASLVAVPADMASAIRNVGGDHSPVIDSRERMTIRQRMQIRQAMHDRQEEILH
jgi:phage head maturation protease